MKIRVNNKEIDLAPGMKVYHALVEMQLTDEIEKGKKAFDEWDNEIGLDGAAVPDMKIFVR